MFVHIGLPGFQALVHQVEERALRGRPLVVATDAGEQAPILACSTEAHDAGLERGMRVAAARQRCPGLVVRLPAIDAARRLQAEVAAAALAFTPLVASAPGRWVVDLRGSEPFWSARLRPGCRVDDPCEQAGLIAAGIRERIADDLGLAPFVGVAARPLSATLAARLARRAPPPRPHVLLIRPQEERQVIDPLPVHWLPIGITLLDHLVFMHHLTIAAVRGLGVEGLRTLAGEAGRSLHAQLCGDEHLLPAALEAEPACSAEATAASGGVGPRGLLALVASLAQQVGGALRRGHLAATRLGLTVRWGTGCTRHAALATGYQLRDDRELIHLAEQLLVRTDDDAGRSCTWLRVSASGLCAAEEQQALFRLDHPGWGLLPTLPGRVAETPG